MLFLFASLLCSLSLILFYIIIVLYISIFRNDITRLLSSYPLFFLILVLNILYSLRYFTFTIHFITITIKSPELCLRQPVPLVAHIRARHTKAQVMSRVAVVAEVVVLAEVHVPRHRVRAGAPLQAPLDHPGHDLVVRVDFVVGEGLLLVGAVVDAPGVGGDPVVGDDALYLVHEDEARVLVVVDAAPLDVDSGLVPDVDPLRVALVDVALA